VRRINRHVVGMKEPYREETGRKKREETGQPELSDFCESLGSVGCTMRYMSRRDRCILPGVACHVTQRGVDRRETFSAAGDRETYLNLIRQNLEDAGVRLLAGVSPQTTQARSGI